MYENCRSDSLFLFSKIEYLWLFFLTQLFRIQSVLKFFIMNEMQRCKSQKLINSIPKHCVKYAWPGWQVRTKYHQSMLQQQ